VVVLLNYKTFIFFMLQVVSRSFFLFLALLAYFLLHATAHAQQSAGVEIIPATIEESADPGEVLERTIQITNISDETKTYFFGVRDISGVANENQPIFAEPGLEKTGFELSEWVELPSEPLTLAPAEKQTFLIRINVPNDASPGSHFGGIFASVEAPRLRTIGAGVGYEVGAIVSIRISGDIVESARIRSFSTEKLIYSEPNVSFVTRVENSGNVLVRPRGPLTIQNMFGKEVATVSVNDSLGGVFPGTERSFTSSWTDDGIGFGRYQAIVALAYGEPGRISSIDATVSFWILPLRIILPILGILTLIILILYVVVRLHIRNSLERLSTRGGRRVVHRRRRDTGTSKLVLVTISLLATVVIFLMGLLILFA
jgi:hypothetical protein